MWANIFLILGWGNLSKYITNIRNYKRLKILTTEELKSSQQKKS